MTKPLLDQADYDLLAEAKGRLSVLSKDAAKDAYDKQFDLNKHLTTLGASTIVVLAAFLDKRLDDTAIIWLGLSLLGMVITVALGSIGMLFTVNVHRSRSSLYETIIGSHTVIESVKPIVDHLNELETMVGAITTPEEEEKTLKRYEDLKHEREKWLAAYEAAQSRQSKAINKAACHMAWEEFVSRAGSVMFVVGLLALALFMGYR